MIPSIKSGNPTFENEMCIARQTGYSLTSQISSLRSQHSSDAGLVVAGPRPTYLQ